MRNSEHGGPGAIIYSTLWKKQCFLPPIPWAFTTKNALAGVEKNSRCSLRRMRCAYCEDCAKSQNEELALLVE